MTGSSIRMPLLLIALGVSGLTTAFAQAPQAPAAGGAAQAGQAQRAPLPEGYWPRGKRPEAGKAPSMRVTDLGKGGRTYRVNFSRGDEMLSGLTEFAEKYKIKNGHFSGLGAINKGILGWTNTELGNGQKMIPVNEQAEVIAFAGSISTNAQGVATVHAHGAVSTQSGTVIGGHIFELNISIIGEVYVTEEEEPAPAAPPAR